MALASLSTQGVQFAVCSMATRRLAGMIARAVSGNADAIFAELTANLVSNGRMVSAGIVAVNRAQERGYSFVSA
jgi:intracellular sulfur oxidation DsrE/DsrF family protein